jgi:hypothetical protein
MGGGGAMLYFVQASPSLPLRKGPQLRGDDGKKTMMLTLLHFLQASLSLPPRTFPLLRGDDGRKTTMMTMTMSHILLPWESSFLFVHILYHNQTEYECKNKI